MQVVCILHSRQRQQQSHATTSEANEQPELDNLLQPQLNAVLDSGKSATDRPHETVA